MYIDCYRLCGTPIEKCKNKYCSANPKYVAPAVKEKEKQGSGKAPSSVRSKIPKFEDMPASKYKRAF